MRRLKRFPDGCASTAWDWDYTGFLCNLYRYADPNHCHHSQSSRTQSPLNPFYTWCNMLLTGLYHSPLVSIPLLLSSNSSILLLHLLFFLPSLTCTRVRGNHHHHPKFDMQKWICILCIWYAYYVHIFIFKKYCHSVMHCCWMCFCLSVSNTRNLFYSY